MATWQLASQMETWHSQQEMEDVIDRINAQRLEDGVALNNSR